jgi:hypothetical protein
VASLDGAEPSIRVSHAKPNRVKFANQVIIDHAFKYVLVGSRDYSLDRAILKRLASAQ